MREQVTGSERSSASAYVAFAVISVARARPLGNPTLTVGGDSPCHGYREGWPLSVLSPSVDIHGLNSQHGSFRSGIWTSGTLLFFFFFKIEGGSLAPGRGVIGSRK